ncbi:VirK family protein [Brucella sp. IR073]|uniref:VirK family protein n=1 Tax=unclassified Brucella TaxID=2632610 RepID=UPI003B987305
MRYFSKALTALFILGSAVQAQAARPQSTGEYEHLRDRLLAGLPTVSIVDLSQCKMKDGKKPDALGPVGGLLIQDFMIMPEPHPSIGYSDNHMTVTPDGTPVLEVVQYRVMPDDTATVTANRFLPRGYKRISKPMVFDCQVGTALRFEPKEKSGIIPADNG